jgi:predicted O-methyltransferase YrrM
MTESLPYEPNDSIEMIKKLVETFEEPITSGSSYVTGANRLMLLGLALSMNAKDILETGYNTGYTTFTLALSGARVVGIDNEFEQPSLKHIVLERAKQFPNVELVQDDALVYLTMAKDKSFDFVFIDDCHWAEYTRMEIHQVRRILRHGGCVVFHDTHFAHIWDVIEEEFPVAWQRINLPSIQGQSEAYRGRAYMKGKDLGLAIVRKPMALEDRPALYEGISPGIVGRHGRIQTNFCTSWEEDGKMYNVVNNDRNDLVRQHIGLLEMHRDHLAEMPDDVLQQSYKLLRQYGRYCSGCASQIARNYFEQIGVDTLALAEGEESLDVV